MDYLTVDNIQIPYNITRKKNKNTYFYFKREGYIQINLSTYQTKKEALDYIIENKHKFLSKLSNTSKKKPHNEDEFLLLGQVYKIIVRPNEGVLLDNEVAYIPSKDIAHPSIKSFYKNEMYKVIHYLVNKYNSNPYVDISNVTYKTRYTNTRHGSCNAKKRNINFNLHLIKYDVSYIEYVFLHEIAHLVHQNHGVAFYNLLEKLSPNYKQLRKELRNIYR